MPGRRLHLWAFYGILNVGSAMFAIVGVQGYLQELLLQHTFQNRYSLFVTALQCGGLALMATVQLALAPDNRCASSCSVARVASFPCAAPTDQCSGSRKGRGTAAGTPGRFYLLLSILQGCGMAATNRAVQSLNYPTKVVFKSSKPAVVMIYSTLFLGKTYGVQVRAALSARRSVALPPFLWSFLAGWLAGWWPILPGGVARCRTTCQYC